MLSGRVWAILVIAFVVIAILATLALDPVLAVGPATGLSWLSANWDCYMISIGFPIAMFYSLVWNPAAERATNPLTGRFVSHGLIAGVAVILAVLGFVVVTYVAIPTLYLDFLTYSMGPGYAPVDSLFLQIALIAVLPLTCVAIASPAGFARTFSSIGRSL